MRIPGVSHHMNGLVIHGGKWYQKLFTFFLMSFLPLENSVVLSCNHFLCCWTWLSKSHSGGFGNARNVTANNFQTLKICLYETQNAISSWQDGAIFDFGMPGIARGFRIFHLSLSHRHICIRSYKLSYEQNVTVPNYA